jgi:hypothetical protein
MKVSDLYENYRIEAAQYANSFGINTDDKTMTAIEKMQWDAFRHAYASASMANEYGYAVAEMAGYAVELGGFLKGNSLESSNMDLWNNSVGRDIGSNSDFKDEMAKKVFDALNKGDLITDPLNDNRLYGLFFPKGYSPDDHSTIPSRMKNLFDPEINPTVNDWWEQARNWIARYDPLVLDLDGDGIETVGVNATTHILFDHNNDGIKTGTGWVNGDDGLLVLDRNGNGVIDNGSELFGDGTMVNGIKATDGFSALRFRHPERVSGSKKSAMNNLDFNIYTKALA